MVLSFYKTSQSNNNKKRQYQQINHSVDQKKILMRSFGHNDVLLFNSESQQLGSVVFANAMS